MKVWIKYRDQYDGCSDPECCGGPNPMPSVLVFSSLASAKTMGVEEDDLTAVEIDTLEWFNLY